MRIRVGKNAATGDPITVDTTTAVNAHMQVTGVTGIGKTWALQELVTSFVESAADMQQPVRVHVFDPHGDIELPYSSVVKFSEATGYGYNPLEVNPDPDNGGVRRAIEKFIAVVKKHKDLGTKQETALRYLLEDLYAAHGFKADDARSWIPDDPRMIREVMRGREDRVYLDVTFEQRERFKTLLRQNPGIEGGFDDFDNDPAMRSRRCWWIARDHYDGDFLMWEPRNLFKTAPSLDDAVRFTERKLKAHFTGSNSAAMTLLMDVNRAARAYHRRVAEVAKRDAALDEAEKAELVKALEKAKEKASDAYKSYLDAVVTGRELDELIRYNSTDVLTSVYERLQNLRAIGIYTPVPPPFDPSKPIWQYQIGHLEIPVQSSFADVVAARLFERAMHRGRQPDVVELLVFDEGKRFVGESNEDTLNHIANEARKYGLGLWIFCQTPAHFPDDFIKATATILVLGLAHVDNKLAARKLGVDEGMLKQVIPQKTGLVQIKRRGTLAQDFTIVDVS